MYKKKFHINNNYEVHSCGANTEEKCPYYGKFGNNNHYDDQNEATRVSQLLMSKKHSLIPSQKKDSSRFFDKKNEILSILKKNKIDTKKIPEVYTMKDMIHKWFNGDKEVYEELLNINNNKDYKDSTKRSLIKFLINGVIIDDVNSIQSMNNVNNTLDSKSNITIIDDFDDNITLDDLRKGRLQAFV